MNSVAHQRCFNHALREAVARCPDCTRFFCRECVTEHDDRVLCTACLKRKRSADPVKRRALLGLKRIAQLTMGILMAWFFFFLVGRTLMELPESFHEGTLWKVPWLERR